jgi:Skp family chaperone for outer membrane proteins
MMNNRRMFGKIVLGAALVAPAIAAAYQSIADNPPMAAPPVAKSTVTVHIDLERVFHGIPAWIENDAKMRRLADELEEKRKAKLAEANDLEQDLDLLPEDSPKHKEIQEAFRRKAMEARVYAEYVGAKLKETGGASLREMYLNLVQRQLPAFAKANGYDYVLLNDNTRPIDQGNEDQVTNQMSARRVLYANPALDATDALIAWITANPQ